MKNSKLFKLILIFLLLFFSLQFLSHFFLSFGLKKENPPRSGPLKISRTLFPIDAELIYEHAFALLEEHTYLKGEDRSDLEEGVKGFKRVIGLNPLFYQAHFNLGKAFQPGEIGTATLFDDALKNLKRAAVIRGTNPRIGAELVKFSLGIWPFLEKKDKDLVRQTLGKSLEFMSGDDFGQIVKMWGIHSRNLDFFDPVFLKNHRFLIRIAKEMEGREIHMEERQGLLSRSESLYLSFFKRSRLPYLSSELKNRLHIIKAYDRQLSENVSGYFRITGNKDFNISIYWDLKTSLMLKYTEAVLSTPGRSVSVQSREELWERLRAFINYCDSPGHIKRIFEFFKIHNYFRENDFKMHYLEMVFLFRSGKVHEMIQKGDSFRQAMSFVREEQKKDYFDILMLLIKEYFETGGVNRVEEVLEEAERVEPENEEVCWLKCKMLHITSQMLDVGRRSEGLVASGKLLRKEKDIGERKSEIRNTKFETSTNDQNLRKEKEDRSQEEEEKIKTIKNSRVVELNRTRIKKIIYFMDEPVIVIQLGEKFREKIKDKHLLQVFINGWIMFEQYLGKVKEKVKVKVEGKEWEKVEVEVRVR